VIKFDRIRNTNKSYSSIKSNSLEACIKARKDYEIANAAITNRSVKYELAHELLGHPSKPADIGCQKHYDTN
jgi:hypothetical protein